MTKEAEQHSALVNAVRSAAVYLQGVADTADGWAEQSRSGGWSTHQVEANRALANDCRRRASELIRSI